MMLKLALRAPIHPPCYAVGLLDESTLGTRPRCIPFGDGDHQDASTLRFVGEHIGEHLPRPGMKPLVPPLAVVHLVSDIREVSEVDGPDSLLDTSL